MRLRERRRLIHWSGAAGHCSRLDSGAGTKTDQQGETTITWLGKADHIENVTCPICRAVFRRGSTAPRAPTRPRGPR